MRLSFHGADRDVTGSCHMLSVKRRRILVDCGMFQGSRELSEDNADDFGFDPGAIDFLLLTHAHLDHCGRIPLLAKRGFRGEIIATAATRELARLVLLDSAHLHEEEARHHARRGGRGEPLYTVLDALNCLDLFGRTARYNEPMSLGRNIEATFVDAGHILGSASIFLNVTEGGQRKSVLFSGDLGNSGRPLLRDPAPARADVVVMETTYGDRMHRSLEASVSELHGAVAESLSHGGNVVIPTFALERAQEILFYLRDGTLNGALSKTLQVFLDSPMAISATEIFKRHPECYEPEIAELFAEGHDPFTLPGLHFVRETAESIALNEIRSGALIMAGSGMCTGGRVRHHLRHNLSRENCSVIFVGYAAHGTLARTIIDGAKRVRLFGDDIPVRARIYTINGFSAHADQRELLAWHKRTGAPDTTFLVHGDQRSMETFAGCLENTRIEMPAFGAQYDL